MNRGLDAANICALELASVVSPVVSRRPAVPASVSCGLPPFRYQIQILKFGRDSGQFSNFASDQHFLVTEIPKFRIWRDSYRSLFIVCYHCLFDPLELYKNIFILPARTRSNLVPQTTVTLGVLATLSEDLIRPKSVRWNWPLWSPVVSRGPPVACLGLLWSPTF